MQAQSPTAGTEDGRQPLWQRSRSCTPEASLKSAKIQDIEPQAASSMAQTGLVMQLQDPVQEWSDLLCSEPSLSLCSEPSLSLTYSSCDSTSANADLVSDSESSDDSTNLYSQLVHTTRQTSHAAVDTATAFLDACLKEEDVVRALSVLVHANNLPLVNADDSGEWLLLLTVPFATAATATTHSIMPTHIKPPPPHKITHKPRRISRAYTEPHGSAICQRA